MDHEEVESRARAGGVAARRREGDGARGVFWRANTWDPSSDGGEQNVPRNGANGANGTSVEQVSCSWELGTCGGAHRPRPARVHLPHPHRRFLPLARRTGAGHLFSKSLFQPVCCWHHSGERDFSLSWHLWIGSATLLGWQAKAVETRPSMVHCPFHGLRITAPTNRVRPFLTGAGAGPARPASRHVCDLLDLIPG